MNDNYQIGPGASIELRYAVFDAEGECIASGETLSAIFGFGQLLPALEHALNGARVGDERVVRLKARDAYGPWRKEAVLEVDSQDFPDEVAPGDHFEVENELGHTLVFKVLDVVEDLVVLDTNHPLAGQDVRIELAVLSVKPATQGQLDGLQQSLEDAKLAGQSLLPLESLLRGGSRR